MKVKLDEHMQSVLEYMQQSIPTNKLVGIAEKLPDMARLLWCGYSQEPFQAIKLANELEDSHVPQLIST